MKTTLRLHAKLNSLTAVVNKQLGGNNKILVESLLKRLIQNEELRAQAQSHSVEDFKAANWDIVEKEMAVREIALGNMSLRLCTDAAKMSEFSDALFEKVYAGFVTA